MNRADYSLLFSPISALKFLLGFKVRTDGQLDTVALRQAAGALLQHGVRELVVIPSATLMVFSLTYRRQRVPATPRNHRVMRIGEDQIDRRAMIHSCPVCHGRV